VELRPLFCSAFKLFLVQGCVRARRMVVYCGSRRWLVASLRHHSVADPIEWAHVAFGRCEPPSDSQNIATCRLKLPEGVFVYVDTNSRDTLRRGSFDALVAGYSVGFCVDYTSRGPDWMGTYIWISGVVSRSSASRHLSTMGLRDRRLERLAGLGMARVNEDTVEHMSRQVVKVLCEVQRADIHRISIQSPPQETVFGNQMHSSCLVS